MRTQDIKGSNGQSEFARVCKLAYTLPKRDKLFPAYLQCQNCSVSACLPSDVLCHQDGAQEFNTHVCGPTHEALPDIVYPVAVQTKAVRLVRSVYQVLDVLPYVFVQLLEHSLSLLLQVRKQSTFKH